MQHVIAATEYARTVKNYSNFSAVHKRAFVVKQVLIGLIFSELVYQYQGITTQAFEAQSSMYFIFRFAYNVCTIAFSWVLDAYILQWATDQDIANAIADIGVTDFQDVKFFENRANGQSKGFCVISLGSDQSIRMVMDRLPKKEIHGQHPVVTLPTKQVTTSKFIEAWSRLFKFNNIFNKNDFLFVL